MNISCSDTSYFVNKTTVNLQVANGHMPEVLEP